MFRRFIRDSVIYAIPTFVSRGLAFFLIPLYTRILSPSDFGALDMMLVFGGLMNLVVALEVSQGVARFYAEDPDLAGRRAYISSAFWFSVGCYGLFTLFALANSRMLSALVTGKVGQETSFSAAVIYISLNGIFYLIQNQFRWELLSRRYAESSLLVTFGTAGAAIFFSDALGWGLKGFLWGMALGAGLGVVYGGWRLRHSLALKFDRYRLEQMLRYSVPLVPAGMAVWLSGYMDRLMIGHYLSLHEVGLYGVGARLSSVVGLVIAGVQGALIPLVFAHYREPETPMQLARIFRWFLAGSLLVYTVMCLFARDILMIMTTPEFHESASLVTFLVPASLLAQMYIFAPGISIAKKSHLYIWLNLMGVLVSGALSWWFIPISGMIGAAVATLVGNGCVFALSMAISQKLYPVPHDWASIASATALAVGLIITMPLIATVGNMHWLVSMLYIGVVVTGFIFLGLILKNEVVSAFGAVCARLRSWL